VVSSQAIHTRQVRDPVGTLWQVTESHAPDVPGAMGLKCLIFDSQAICRRYWIYPIGWFALSDDHLLDFMNQSRQPAC
jgi:hypothetical protein